MYTYLSQMPLLSFPLFANIGYLLWSCCKIFQPRGNGFSSQWLLFKIGGRYLFINWYLYPILKFGYSKWWICWLEIMLQMAFMSKVVATQFDLIFQIQPTTTFNLEARLLNILKHHLNNLCTKDNFL